MFAGDSAGAHLAVAVSLQLRDKGFSPLPRLQVCLSPILQILDLDLPSSRENWNGPFLTRSHLAWYFSTFLLGNQSGISAFLSGSHVPEDARIKFSRDGVDPKIISGYVDGTSDYAAEAYDISVHNEAVWTGIRDFVYNPYFSPLLTASLRGTPETVVYAAQYDVVRDDAILYTHKLKKEGVNVHLILDPKGWHLGIFFFPVDRDGWDAMMNVVTIVRNKL